MTFVVVFIVVILDLVSDLVQHRRLVGLGNLIQLSLSLGCLFACFSQSRLLGFSSLRPLVR